MIVLFLTIISILFQEFRHFNFNFFFLTSNIYGAEICEEIYNYYKQLWTSATKEIASHSLQAGELLSR